LLTEERVGPPRGKALDWPATTRLAGGHGDADASTGFPTT